MKTAGFLVIGLLGACAYRPPPPSVLPVSPQLFSAAAAEVADLARDTNEGRFEALTGLLSKRQISFEVESFTIEPRKTESRTSGRNIVVTFPGVPPEVVVGAHYDAARLGDGTMSRGAVDNAASVAILLRLAERFLRARPRHTVRLIFFDMEELGLLGSAQYVRAHPERKVALMLNLDVNAFGDTVILGPRGQANGVGRRHLVEACVAVGERCLEFPEMPPSDDRSFASAGVPAVSIATLPERQAHQLWLSINGGKPSGLAEKFLPDVLQLIHSSRDQVDLVDAAAMQRAYRVTLEAIRALDRNGT
jgi:Zn-dependent M28 family amino/carboxypeptidase